MKTITKFLLSLFVWLSISLASAAQGQPVQLMPNKPVNWSTKQLMQPSELAAILSDSKLPKPLILNIGVVEDIPGARHLGAASKLENIQKLRTILKGLPKNSPIVVYCGCCPFDKCPNIRPAFQELISGGFTNAKVLNLPTNIKTDWINKGYPVEK